MHELFLIIICCIVITVGAVVQPCVNS